MKSVGVTLSPVEFSMLSQLSAAYNANRSEVIRAAIRQAHSEYVRECNEPQSDLNAPIQLDFFGAKQ
jgi:metal-responsive CopG/Arc/MetJ family transcriptional regulator